MNDPTKIFIVQAIKRSDIAGDLNMTLEDWRSDGADPETFANLSEDDYRLTDEICKEYAENLGEIFQQGWSEDTEMQAMAELQYATLEKIGINEPDWGDPAEIKTPEQQLTEAIGLLREGESYVKFPHELEDWASRVRTFLEGKP